MRIFIGIALQLVLVSAAAAEMASTATTISRLQLVPYRGASTSTDLPEFVPRHLGLRGGAGRMKVAFLTAGGLAPCLSSSIGYLIEAYNNYDPSIELIAYVDGYKVGKK